MNQSVRFSCEVQQKLRRIIVHEIEEFIAFLSSLIEQSSIFIWELEFRCTIGFIEVCCSFLKLDTP